MRDKTGAFRFLFYRRKNKNTPIVGMIFLRRILSLLSQNRENIALKSKRKIFGETMVFQIARKHKKESIMIKHVIKTKKCKDRIRLYSILFIIGILVGIFCRLTDFSHMKAYGVCHIYHHRSCRRSSGWTCSHTWKL